MGRWFPDRRKGNRDQVAAHDKAQRDLNENTERERRERKAARPGARNRLADGLKGGGSETPRYRELNREVNVRAKPLSPFQQSRMARDARIAAAERRERRADTDPRAAWEKAHRPAWSRYGRWEAKEQQRLDRQRAKAQRGRGSR